MHICMFMNCVLFLKLSNFGNWFYYLSLLFRYENEVLIWTKIFNQFSQKRILVIDGNKILKRTKKKNRHFVWRIHYEWSCVHDNFIFGNSAIAYALKRNLHMYYSLHINLTSSLMPLINWLKQLRVCPSTIIYQIHYDKRNLHLAEKSVVHELELVFKSLKLEGNFNSEIRYNRRKFCSCWYYFTAKIFKELHINHILAWISVQNNLL